MGNLYSVTFPTSPFFNWHFKLMFDKDVDRKILFAFCTAVSVLSTPTEDLVSEILVILD